MLSNDHLLHDNHRPVPKSNTVCLSTFRNRNRLEEGCHELVTTRQPNIGVQTPGSGGDRSNADSGVLAWPVEDEGLDPDGEVRGSLSELSRADLDHIVTWRPGS